MTFSERSEWLLFFLVQPDHIFLIDVRSHDEPGIFQAIDLVEKAIRSWPEFGEKFAVKGALRLAQPPETSASAIKQIRTGGVSQLLEIDGVVYMSPGLGVTSASTSVRVSLERNRVKQLAENIGTFFTNTDGEPMRTVRARGVTDPSFSLQLSPQGRLIIVCPEAAIHWPFPSASHQQDARVQLEQALLPAWASAKLAPFLAARLAKERCKAEHLAQKKFQAGGASDGDAAE